MWLVLKCKITIFRFHQAFSWARVPERRPEQSAKRGEGAGVEALGPCRMLGESEKAIFLKKRYFWIRDKRRRYSALKSEIPTHPNPRYSAKNNVAIPVIATFMLNLFYLFHQNWFITQTSFCFSAIYLICFCLYAVYLLYIHLDMFQIELVSIILPWIEIFIQIWFLWNHTTTASFFTQNKGFK